MPTAKMATRPMPAIALDTATVVLVDHGNGAGWGLTVDGAPVPNVMLLPAGAVDRYSVIVGGVFYLQVSRDEAMRWAPLLARWHQSMTGSINGHAGPATNGAPKPAARVRAPRPSRAGAARPTATSARSNIGTTTAAATAPKTAARRGPPTPRK